jgi:hypothetical protein
MKEECVNGVVMEVTCVGQRVKPRLPRCSTRAMGEHIISKLYYLGSNFGESVHSDVPFGLGWGVL